MVEYLCGGVRTVESEFQAGLTGACGPNAAASAARWADQSATSPTTATLFQKMHTSLGLGGSNGVSTLSDLERTLRALGYTLTFPNAGEGVLAFCARLAGYAALVLEVAHGQSFVDYLTGQGEDATNLQYHFVCVLGRNGGSASALTTKVLPAGYWVADGDNNVENPIINGARVHRGLNSQLVYYPDAVVSAAQPYGAFAVQPRVRVSVEGFMGIPTGWHDDGTVLTASNGIAVVKGFRDWVLAHTWDANNTPLAAEQAITSGSIEPGNAAMGPGSRQDFRFTSLGWTTKTGVYQIAVGQDLVALLAQQAALLAQVSAANSQIGSLQQQLAQQTVAQSAISELKKALATA